MVKPLHTVEAIEKIAKQARGRKPRTTQDPIRVVILTTALQAREGEKNLLKIVTDLPREKNVWPILAAVQSLHDAQTSLVQVLKELK